MTVGRDTRASPQVAAEPDVFMHDSKSIWSKPVWPMQTGGGAFLFCVGLGLLAGGLAGGSAILVGLVAGALAGFISIPFAVRFARGRFGRPTRLNIIVMWIAIGAEIAGFLVASKLGYFRHGFDFTAAAVALTIVALHFVIMRWSHGPWMLVLAAAILIWVALALWLRLTIGALIAGDGILKLLFGFFMAAPLLRQTGATWDGRA
jgi:hypothetical protein